MHPHFVRWRSSKCRPSAALMSLLKCWEKTMRLTISGVGRFFLLMRHWARVSDSLLRDEFDPHDVGAKAGKFHMHIVGCGLRREFDVCD